MAGTRKRCLPSGGGSDVAEVRYLLRVCLSAITVVVQMSRLGQ